MMGLAGARRWSYVMLLLASVALLMLTKSQVEAKPNRGHHRRGHSDSSYWWQNNPKPFAEGAGQNHGVQSGSLRPGQTVVGCSGEACAGPLFSSSPAVASSSSSSSSSGGGSCCNFYWQKPGHPCANHQGPGCPSGFNCVNYRSCSNGFITQFTAGYDSGTPSRNELMEFGKPCGNSGKEVCCQPARPKPPQTYYPPPAPQPVIAPPTTTPAPPPVYYPPPPPPTQAPIYYPPPTKPPTQAPVYYPPATTQAPPPQIYYPPVTEPALPPVAAAVVAPVGPPASGLPYPGCAAALKCVLEEYCNIEGVMVNTPVFYTEQQKIFRTPLMSCLNVETNQVGYCCRDPLYNDPWPADMPMPMMTKPPPAPEPVIQQVTYCPSNQECVPAHVCASWCDPNSFHQTNNQQQCTLSGTQNGVCCSRPPPPPPQPVVVEPPPDLYLPPPPPPTTTTTPRPPPPPTAAPVVAPPVEYLPPPVEYLPPPPPPPTTTTTTTTTTTPPPPPPPTTTTTTTTTTPPPPPPTAPVVAPPLEYLPPPPTSAPVILPPVDYLPPPKPAVDSQVVQQQQPQCGASQPLPGQPIGNGEAPLGKYPWHAMVAMRNGSMSCSGALISPKFVVTALHCVKGVPPTSLIVRLGEQRVGMMDEPLPHYEIPVSAVVGHPNFEEGSLFNDIAVLMLSSPAPSGLSYISPICLPSSSYEQLPNQCVVTGWGHDTLSGLHTGVLNEIQVNPVSNANCQTSLQTTHLGKYFKLHQSFACASTQNSINPCKVDGGSPLACQRPDGSYVLAGLSSWSVGCSNQQQPGVYVDVPPLTTWIQQQVAQPEANLVDTSNAAFNNQQQFQQSFGPGAGYGR